MKKFIVASVGLILGLCQANAGTQPNILELAKEGYEIKAVLGSYVLMQKEAIIFACTPQLDGQTDFPDDAVPSDKFPCKPFR